MSIVFSLRLPLLLGAALGMAQAAYSFDPVREGSYRNSCRNIELENEVLYATCRTNGGGWRNTTLHNPFRCRGDISNRDGNLHCHRNRDDGGHGGDWDDWDDDISPWPPAGRPSGSYTRSCKEISMHGDDLYAKCRKRDGDWKRTVLRDVWSCRGPVSNDNGNLRCARW